MDIGWVLRSLSIMGLRAPQAGGAADDALDTLRAVLQSGGFSTAERAFDRSHVKDLPLDSLVELRDGSVGIVRARGRDRLALEAERGRLDLSGDAISAELTGRALFFYRAPNESIVRTLLKLAVSDASLSAALRDTFAVSVLLRLFTLVMPLLTREAIARAIPDGERSTLFTLAIAITTTGLFIALCIFLRARATRYVETHVSERFSRELFVAMLEQPFDAITARRPGAAWQDFSETDQWIRLTVPQILAALDGLFGVAFLIALALFAPFAALVVAFSSLAAFAVVTMMALGQEAPRRLSIDARRARQDTLLQCVDSIEVVRAEGLEPHFESRLFTLLRDEQQAALDLGSSRAKVEGVSSGLERGLFVLVYAMLGWQCLEGKASVADVVASVQLVAAFELGFHGLLAAPERFAALRALRFQLGETLNVFAQRALRKPEAQAPSSMESATAAISVDDVWFRHEGSPDWIFTGYSLNVKRGEQVTLSWASGAGKTTLLRLIAGLQTPSRGSVRIEGESPSATRDLVCYVPQGAPLLSRSVMENLVVMSGGASRERILKAAQATGLDKVVADWTMKWNTVLSGGGRTISSGQRQLVFLTAAVASHAPVVLLDEALAHLDAETKRAFLAQDPFAGRTVIFVEHEPRGNL